MISEAEAKTDARCDNGYVPLDLDDVKMTPENVRKVLSAIADPEVCAKAAGVIWWDTCETLPKCACQACPFRPTYPVGAVAPAKLYRVLRRLGYAPSCARFRSTPVKMRDGTLDERRLDPRFHPVCKSRSYSY